jgi:hypothetical protein
MADNIKQETFPDELIQAPLEFAKNVDIAVNSFDKLAKTADLLSDKIGAADSLSAITKETKELAKAEAELEKSIKAISTAEKTLVKDHDNLEKSTNKSSNATASLNNELKQLQKDIKAAKGEMVRASRDFGEGSKEFTKAAAKAGELQDKLNDVNDALKNTSASPFENVATQLKNVGSKLLSLDFSGALTSSKQLVATSKSITFKEAIGGGKDFIKTIVNLGKAIFTNPLFLLAGVIIGIVAVLYKFRDSIKPVKIAMDVLGQGVDFVIQKFKDFFDWIGLTTFALDEQQKAIKENAAKNLETTKQSFDNQIKLAQAAGKETFELEKQKWIAVRDAAQEGMKNLLDENGKLREEDKEQYKLYNEAIADAALSLSVIEIQIEKSKNDKIKKLADEAFKEEIKKFEAKMKLYDEFGKRAGRTEAERLLDEKKLNEEVNKVQKEKADILVPINKLAKAYNLTKEEEANIQLKLNAYLKQANEELERAQQLKDIANFTAQAQEIYTQFASNVGNLFNQLSNQRIANYDYELKKLEDATQRSIELAGDNDAAKAAIERSAEARRKNIEDKRLREQQRQAKFNKNLSLVQATINTSQAVTSALANYDYVSAVLFGILGAIEIAAIASQDIPKYFKGVDSHPGGKAVVGDKFGSELIGENGKWWLSPNKATTVDLAKGAQVIPHDESMRILALSSLGQQSLEQQRSNDVLNQIKSSNKEVVQAINKNGLGHFERQGSELIKWYDDQKGNRKSIRVTVMGY